MSCVVSEPVFVWKVNFPLPAYELVGYSDEATRNPVGPVRWACISVCVSDHETLMLMLLTPGGTMTAKVRQSPASYRQDQSKAP